MASIGRDLAGYNRQRDYYWLRLSGTCGNDIPFSGSDFRAPKTARHAVACVGRAFSIWSKFYATEAAYFTGSLLARCRRILLRSCSFSSLGVVHTEQCLYYIALRLFYHKQNQKYS